MSHPRLKTDPVSYYATIAYTPSPRSLTEYITVRKFAPEAEHAQSMEEMRNQCLTKAREQGWKPPAWWQWWRRKDSIEPRVDSNL